MRLLILFFLGFGPASPVWAEECDVLNSSVCFGVDWARATVGDVGGVDVGAIDKDGRTPLHWAARRGRADVVRFLIKKGADVRARDNSGRRPIYWADVEGRVGVVELLIEKDMDVGALDEDGLTSSEIAEFRNRARSRALSRLNDQNGAEIPRKHPRYRDILRRAKR